jgi:dTDP-4-amino-4,6-dideoxygalactose transaminase
LTAPSLPISRPYFGEEERRAVQRPLETGWVVQGPYVAEFEQRFAEYVGAEHAVATTSCTTALHIAVAALGVKPGDEVIVPAFTWVSTANVVEYLGGKPVFCDVRLDTFNVDPALIEPLITERTVGLLPVHLFGLAADMPTVTAIAERHGLWVLEDAACGFGTRQGGAHAGTLGTAGCFSFHPRKSITTGEGGMLTTADAELAGLGRTLRDHGASRSDFARHGSRNAFLLADYDHLGFNFRMTDLQAAVGCVQMDRADFILGERARLAAGYGERLADLEWLRLPGVPEGEDHGWQAYVCLFAPEEPRPSNVAALNDRRNALMGALEDEGIATRPGTHAPVETGLYMERYGLREGQFANAHAAAQLSLALPLFPGMTDGDLDRVAEALRRHGAQ